MQEGTTMDHGSQTAGEGIASPEQRVAQNFLRHLTELSLPLDFHQAQYTDPYEGFLRSFSTFEKLPGSAGTVRQIKDHAQRQAPIERKRYPKNWIGAPSLLFAYNQRGSVDILCIDPILVWTQGEWENNDTPLNRARLQRDASGRWQMSATWLQGSGHLKPETYSKFHSDTNNLGSQWVMYQSAATPIVA